MKKKKSSKPHFFERFASAAAKATGSNAAIVSAFAIVILWAAFGPLLQYSEQWQLVINTGTTIITFLMVFLIQRSQNKDSMAIQLNLNELVASDKYASNRLVDVENIPEDELKVIQKYYSQISMLTRKETDIHNSHSIDEAEANHEKKKMLFNSKRGGNN